jgi:RES domain-containing protein
VVNSFRSAEEFRDFRDEVLRKRRYLWSESASEFLRAVAETCRKRIRAIPAGSRFWRAQLGHRLIVDKKSGERLPAPHPEERMRPLSDRAIEGRVNPKGIPCLYFATSPDVAMSEVRPWIGSSISLAAFETTRDLKLVDCSQPEPRAAQQSMEDRVWAEINDAFAEPVVQSDTTGDYAATQILAELFRREGSDGVIYKSAFTTRGLNLALFDLECAKLLESSLYRVENATFEFAPISNADPDQVRPGDEEGPRTRKR